MTLLGDESVERQIVEQLRQDGHSVGYIAETEPSVGDDVVLQRANESGAVLLTEDKDFGELVFRQRLVHHGVVLIRLYGLSADAKAGIVSAALAAHSSELVGTFTVISPGMVRIRPGLTDADGTSQ